MLPLLHHYYITITIISHFRQFRVVNAADFLAHFASDRSHMVTADAGWLAEPPSYPPIQTKG